METSQWTRPLDGLRVCELSIAIAAPTCGKYLAYFGADVIKVESARNPDVIRLLAGDSGPALGEFNAGKRSVGLDLKSTAGMRAMRRLLEQSDVFLTNYTASAIAGLGLGYEIVSRWNPDIVYAGMPGFGSDPASPYYEYVAWGPNQAPLVGLDALTGIPGHEPAGIATISYPDYSSGIQAAAAILAEVRRKQLTGSGACIDLSQMEATISLLGPLILAHQLGEASAPAGNREPGGAPAGVYRCSGTDRWVAISIRSDRDWMSLCRLAGRPDWADDARVSTAQARAANHDLADQMVESWTENHGHLELAFWLQHAGVAAAAVADNEMLAVDPHLSSRGFWVLADQSRVGTDLFTGVPVRLERTPGGFGASGPPFAEHTDEVLRDVCGYSSDEVQTLITGDGGWLAGRDLPQEARPWLPWARVAMPYLQWDDAVAGVPDSPATRIVPSVNHRVSSAGGASRKGAPSGSSDLALSGVRVVAIDGPEMAQAIRIMAGLGADVLLAEPPGGGRLRKQPVGDRTGLWLAAFGGGCSSVVIDLATTSGAADFRRLVRSSDVVLEGSQPYSLDELGVGYESHAGDNPGLVWVSVTPYGRSGPYRRWRGSNLTAWAASGVLYTTGHGDTPPVTPGGSAMLAWHLAAANALVGTLAALIERDRSGAGQLVEVSVYESTVAAACETGVPLYLLDRRHRSRQGNRRPHIRPWGLYPCRDGWVSIAVLQPAHWRAIAAWIYEETGSDGAIEPVFEEMLTRVQVPELLDQWTEELCQLHTKVELFQEGQRRGVPVTPLNTVADLLADEHLAATGYWSDLDMAELGRLRVPGPPWRLKGREWRGGGHPALGVWAETVGEPAGQQPLVY